MPAKPNTSVVITGASSGIGAATAKYLAERGWTVFAGVRKAEDAEQVRDLADQITPVQLDVTKPDSLQSAVETVRDELGGQKLGGLVNNAGIAQMGPLAEQSMDEIEAHFSVNALGVIRTAKAFIPLLGADDALAGGPGRIINITSIGGRVASPFLGAYCATKHAVEAFTGTLRRELIVYGIDAISVGPGAVKTPIWDKEEEQADDSKYADTPWSDSLGQYRKSMLQAGEDGLEPERVAKAVEKALTKRTPKARYAPVPSKWKNFWLPVLLPKRWVDKIFWSRFDITS